MHEIITLQLGAAANFVGAHFWNLQDEAVAAAAVPGCEQAAASINQDVLCAWSEDKHGVASYAPRTVVLDLSGALGGVSFAADAAAAGAAQSCATWAGGVEVHSLGRAPKSSYRQQLEAWSQAAEPASPASLEAQQLALEAAALSLQQQEPKHWTDFLQTDLQPGTALTLPGVWEGAPDWRGWGSVSGSSACKQAGEAALDRVRCWAEQCDALQGLQVFADDLGGWGSLALSLLQELRDDYASQPLIYFSLQQQQQPQHASTAADTTRCLSECISLAEVPQLAGLYLPLTAPPQPAGACGWFRPGALLAAAIDSATLPVRSRSPGALASTDLHSLVHLLGGRGANVAATSLQLPLSSSSGSGGSSSNSSAAGAHVLSIHLEGSNSSSLALLAPRASLEPADCLAETLTLRGLPVAAGEAALQRSLLERQARCPHMRCVAHACLSPLPLALPLSFPSAVAARPPRDHASGVGVQQLGPAALARLTATRSFQAGLQDAARSLARVGRSATGKVLLDSWDYSDSDAGELGERLLALAGRYEADLE